MRKNTTSRQRICLRQELQNKEFSDGSGLEEYDYGVRFYDPTIERWSVIDFMSEKNYDISPYAYVLNNPMRHNDIRGLTDWDAVVKGTLVTLGGLATTIGGAALSLTPTGIGQAAGLVLVPTGIVSTGLGLTQIIAGFKDDNTAGNIPSGLNEALGMAGDHLAKTTPLLRNAGSIADAVIGEVAAARGGTMSPVGSSAATIQTVSKIADAGTLATRATYVYTANDIVNMVKGTNNGPLKNINDALNSAKTPLDLQKSVPATNTPQPKKINYATTPGVYF